jgi:hypothetical protein
VTERCAAILLFILPLCVVETLPQLIGYLLFVIPIFSLAIASEIKDRRGVNNGGKEEVGI